MKRIISTIFFGAVLTAIAISQQVADTAYLPPIDDPAYASGKGPVVFIDKGHNNFHTRGDRYLPFALLLERDGYITEDYTGTFNVEKLSNCRTL
ncbi:MAG: hypothetical protein WAW07_07835 [Bacteroidales bacterium]